MRRASPTRAHESQFPRTEVFLNCPFDSAYLPLYQAIVFTVMAIGYQIRMALEVENSGLSRLAKIVDIIRETPYGIHDISRAGADEQTGLARFNMPLELGLFLGAREYGDSRQGQKVALILDTEQYRYQKFISDIAGNDIEAHMNDPKVVVKKVRNWLSNKSGGAQLPLGGKGVVDHYDKFMTDFPAIRDVLGHDHDVPFKDFIMIVRDWLQATPLPEGSK